MKVYNYTKGTSQTWVCPGLEVSKGKTSDIKKISEDQDAAINTFIKNNPKYVKENPGEDKIGPNKEFIKVDANEVLPKDFPTRGVYFIYKRTGIVGTTQDYVTKFESLLKTAGYTFNEPDVEMEYLLNTKRKATEILGDRYANQFGKTIPFVYLSKDTWDELNRLDRRACRDALKTQVEVL
jgi:hypothetical protein